MRRIKNWVRRIKGYNGCYHCGGAWNSKEKYLIPYREAYKMFPLCRECFEKLDAKTILDYCKKLMGDWKRKREILYDHDMLDVGLLGFDENEAVRTIKNFVEDRKKLPIRSLP